MLMNLMSTRTRQVGFLFYVCITVILTIMINITDLDESFDYADDDYTINDDNTQEDVITNNVEFNKSWTEKVLSMIDNTEDYGDKFVFKKGIFISIVFFKKKKLTTFNSTHQ